MCHWCTVRHLECLFTLIKMEVFCSHNMDFLVSLYRPSITFWSVSHFVNWLIHCLYKLNVKKKGILFFYFLFRTHVLSIVSLWYSTLKIKLFENQYILNIKYRWPVWRALSTLAVPNVFFLTISFNFVFVLETIQLLKYYKTLSMYNKFSDISLLFFSPIVSFQVPSFSL